MRVKEAEVHVESHAAHLRGRNGLVCLLVILGLDHLDLATVERLVDEADLETTADRTAEQFLLIGVLQSDMRILEEADRLGQQDDADAMLCLSQCQGHIGHREEGEGRSLDTHPFHTGQRQDVEILSRAYGGWVVVGFRLEILTETHVVLGLRKAYASQQ